jgi:cytoplasmic iron level regulating protein YaaA (DUF328/UPF0246 family)
VLALLSPAKKLHAKVPKKRGLPITTPALSAEARGLLAVARGRTRADWSSLMDLSDDLANSTFERFQALDLDAAGTPALLTFAGDVYVGAGAHDWSAADLEWAQDHLAILSGLYGVLRPLDGIAPYRLEMGTRLPNPRGKDLYAWWRPVLAAELKARVANHDDKTIVNLASDEYFSAVDAKALGRKVVTPVFQDVKDGKARSLFLFVKRARGRLARWMVEHRVDRPDGLREATFDGYTLDADASTAERPVFRRPQPPPMG